MSQNSLVIGDGSGASVLTAINNALNTLVSQDSGASAPGTTYAYQLWADTANGVLKQRNSANSAWIVRAPLAETLVVSRVSNTILAAGDFGRTILASGTWTQTFNAASSLGDGWMVEYRNDGTGVITLDPNGAEQIDGATTIQLAPGETCCIYCDGAQMKTIGRSSPAAQGQAATAFTTTGTAPAYVITAVPAITALVANKTRLNLTFHAAGTTGSNTGAISGLGALNFKQYDSTGAKVAAVIAAGQNSDVIYDGTDLVLVDPLPPAGSAAIQGAFKNLQASATGTSASVSVSADEVVAETTGNAYQTLRAVSLTINTAAAGANGLDTGTLAASTWYSVWAIYNPTTQTTAGLISLSATAPTMPSGYTFKARVGWIRTDGTANKFPLGFRQYGRKVRYAPAAASNLTGFPQASSGAQGSISTPTWVAVAIGGVGTGGLYLPSTAYLADLLVANMDGGTSGAYMVAPNNGYGARTSLTNPPPINAAAPSAAVSINTSTSLVLESNNIYVAADSTTCGLFILGWEDNL